MLKGERAVAVADLLDGGDRACRTGCGALGPGALVEHQRIIVALLYHAGRRSLRAPALVHEDIAAGAGLKDVRLRGGLLLHQYFAVARALIHIGSGACRSVELLDRQTADAAPLHHRGAAGLLLQHGQADRQAALPDRYRSCAPLLQIDRAARDRLPHLRHRAFRRRRLEQPYRTAAAILVDIGDAVLALLIDDGDVGDPLRDEGRIAATALADRGLVILAALVHHRDLGVAGLRDLAIVVLPVLRHDGTYRSAELSDLRHVPDQAAAGLHDIGCRLANALTDDAVVTTAILRGRGLGRSAMHDGGMRTRCARRRMLIDRRAGTEGPLLDIGGIAAIALGWAIAFLRDGGLMAATDLNDRHIGRRGGRGLVDHRHAARASRARLVDGRAGLCQGWHRQQCKRRCRCNHQGLHARSPLRNGQSVLRTAGGGGMGSSDALRCTCNGGSRAAPSMAACTCCGE